MPKIGGPLELVFTDEGKAELFEGDDPVWHSDADDDFRDEFEDDFLTADDAEEVLEFLVDEGYLQEDELPRVIVSQEDADEVEVTGAHRIIEGEIVDSD